MARENHPQGSRQAKIAAAAPKQRKSTPIIAAVIVLLVVVGVVWAVMAGRGTESGTGSASSDDTAGYAVPPGADGPTGGIVVNAGNVQQGAPGLDIYEDPQCPACAVVDGIMGPSIAQLRDSGSARVAYHIKTFLDDNLRNDSSTRAGNAMSCAAEAGRFPQYHQAIYAEENRPAEEGQGWTDAQLEQFAADSGITGDALNTWRQCQSELKYEEYLAAVEEATARDGVTGTPTYRINGEDFTIQQNTTGDDLIRAVVEAGGTAPTGSPTG